MALSDRIKSVVMEYLQPINQKIEGMQKDIQELSERCNNLHERLVTVEENVRRNNSKLNDLFDKDDDFEKRLFGVEENVRCNNSELQNISEKENNLVVKEDDLEGRIFRVEENVRGNNLAIEYLTTDVENNQVQNLQNDLENLRIFVSKELSSEKEQDAESIEKEECSNNSISEIGDTYSLIDYFDFENHFRGSREVIKQRQEIYLPYFENKENVYDLGCGRGEFVELMVEHHIPVTGVDNYPHFVKYCESRGLPVVLDDALEFLSTAKETGGIFAAQLIEHLTFQQLQKLCVLSYEKLMPDSYLILETPNPRSLAIFTNAFYVDPSHNKPVNPLTIQYMLEKCGFRDVQILYTEESKMPYEIPKMVIDDNTTVEEFNKVMEVVSNMLFGSQDYAVIARK